MSKIISFFSLLVFCNCNAQMVVQTLNQNLTLPRAIKEYFVGDNISTSNISFKGNSEAIGMFTDSNKLLGLKKGIILSTGRVDILSGANSRTNAGANFGDHFFVDEQFITRSSTCDGAVLEFDFIPQFDSISFQFVFGSEEYPEFVGKEFNDLFAFLISAKTSKYNKPKNIAVLPNGTPISINSINIKSNSEWYIPNHLPTHLLYNQLEYDGFTKPIAVGCKVIPKQTYHLKILIADLEDCEYDSGILLEAQSFKSSSTRKPKPIRKNYFFTFETDKAILAKNKVKQVISLCDSLAKFTFDSIVIIGHTDSSGNEGNNNVLSLQRAQTIADYLTQANVKTASIKAIGKGSNKPIRSNKSEKGRAINRRVEIIYYKSN